MKLNIFNQGNKNFENGIILYFYNAFLLFISKKLRKYAKDSVFLQNIDNIYFCIF